LKRKGPADKAYVQKQYYDSVRPADARGRALLAGIMSVRQSDETTAFSDTDNQMRSTWNADWFIQPLEDSACLTQSKSLEEGSQDVLIRGCTTDTHGRECLRRNSASNLAVGDTANGNADVSIRQTQLVASQSVIGVHHCTVSTGSTPAQQPFYHPGSFQDSGDSTAACVWDREPTPLAVMDHPGRTERQVSRSHVTVPDVDLGSGHPTFWTVGSDTVQSNYEPFTGSTYCSSCRSAQHCDSMTLHSVTGHWPDSEVMKGNWFSTNPDPTSYYQGYQSVVSDTIYPV